MVGDEEIHCRLHSLVRAFRTFGHREAAIDPLNLLNTQKNTRELHPGLYGFKMMNKELYFDVDGVVHMGGKTPSRYANLPDILEHLSKVYCGNVAHQFVHLTKPKEVLWLAREIESSNDEEFNILESSPELKKHVHKILLESEVFDHYLSKKYPATKRYGLEGAESMLVVLDSLFENFMDHGVSDLVIGMPHRGRLNFLTGLLNFPAGALFNKINGESEFPAGLNITGDVLSHFGISTNVVSASQRRNLKVSLLNNPSHLEAINPVALGKTRAKLAQDKNAACLLIHGDSSFTGQGIVSEILELSKLPHFGTDNQLGFTTSAEHTRSSRCAGDIGKMVGTPMFHVNGEKLEDILRIVKIAVKYRKKFKKDVIIELMTYRKHGHNELDEPSFTQPKMYDVIKSMESLPVSYGKELIKEGIIKRDDVKEIKSERIDLLDKEYHNAKNYTPHDHYFRSGWKSMGQAKNVYDVPETGYDLDYLVDIGFQSVNLPKDFKVHPRLEKYHIGNRKKMLEVGTIDWATSEALAIGSLLNRGYNIRLSGQDVGRGTFSQRHMEFYCQKTNKMYQPLQKLPKKQGELYIVPSPLSELAVLGYEYGYSIHDPNNFCIWEAQFGDFSLNAQTIIDQFICSGEDKWLLQSGITLLLPHGYDGAGSEHSSSKVERYLQLSDCPLIYKERLTQNINIFVVNCTTPANYFHVLRRQMKRKYRKPLIVISPKTLLRMDKCVSPISEFDIGTKFQPVLDDSTFIESKSTVETVILCSGKIYYLICAEREKTKGLCEKVAVIRLEELSPFPFVKLKEILGKYKNAKKFKWVQEEPENMGAYSYVEPRLLKNGIVKNLEYVGRKAYSSSATGISKIHKQENLNLIKNMFN